MARQLRNKNKETQYILCVKSLTFSTVACDCWACSCCAKVAAPPTVALLLLKEAEECKSPRRMRSRSRQPAEDVHLEPSVARYSEASTSDYVNV